MNQTYPTGPEQVRDLAMQFVATNGVPGDYLEFGVFQGKSLFRSIRMHDSFSENLGRSIPRERSELMAKVMDFQEMRFFAFDSFLGLSTPMLNEKPLQAGDFCCPLETFRARAYQEQLLNRITIFPAWFSDLTDETLKNLRLTKAAIIHIDCDLYEPSRDALKFCTPIIQDGTVLVFDDWFLFNGRKDQGQQRAFAEWSQQHNIETSQLHSHGAVAFIVHR